MTEPPEQSIAPGAFPFVLFVCFAEPCVLADLMKVDEFYLHVFCSVSVVRFVRPCDIATLVCGFHCILFQFTRLKVLCEHASIDMFQRR